MTLSTETLNCPVMSTGSSPAASSLPHRSAASSATAPCMEALPKPSDRRADRAKRRCSRQVGPSAKRIPGMEPSLRRLFYINKNRLCSKTSGIDRKVKKSAKEKILEIQTDVYD